MSSTKALSPCPILQYFDNQGNPNAGGSILTQVGGINAATYEDSAGNTPLPNPIPLNSRGEVSNAAGASKQLFLTPGSIYTFFVYDKNGNLLNEPQNVVAGSQAAVATAASLRSAAAGSVQNPVFIDGFDGGWFWQDSTDTTSAEDGGTYCGTIIRGTDYATNGVWKRSYAGRLNVVWYGAKGDNSTDNTTTLQNAINASMNQSRDLTFGGAGTFKFTSLLWDSVTGYLPDVDFSGVTLAPTGANSYAIRMRQQAGFSYTAQRQFNSPFVNATGFTGSYIFQLENLNFTLWQSPKAVNLGNTTEMFYCLNSIFWSENNTFIKPMMSGGKRMFHWALSGGGTNSFARTIIQEPFVATAASDAWFYAESNVAVYDSYIANIAGNYQSAAGNCVLYAGGDWTGSYIGPFQLENNGGNSLYLVNIGTGGTRKPVMVGISGSVTGASLYNSPYPTIDAGTYLRAYPGLASAANDGTLVTQIDQNGVTIAGAGHFYSSIISSVPVGTPTLIPNTPVQGSMLIVASVLTSGGPMLTCTAVKPGTFGVSSVVNGANAAGGGQTLSVTWAAAAEGPRITLTGGVTAQNISVAWLASNL